MKASEGALYLLEKYFIFVPKPAILVPIQEIKGVELQRVGSGSGNVRTFDISIHMSDCEHVFNNVSKDELQLLERFLRSKDVTIITESKKTSVRRDLNESSEGDYSESETSEKRARIDDEGSSSKIYFFSG